MRYAARLANRSWLRSDSDTQPPVGGAFKRGFDIAGAIAGILLLSPVASHAGHAGQIFLRRPRLLWPFAHRPERQRFPLPEISHHGGEWRSRCWRSISPGTPHLREEWIATRKLQNDPRVTQVGAVLRKLSLDELPQIFNILRGDMSFVGPRPVVEDELELYGPAADYYLKSRPGLTGLWQSQRAQRRLLRNARRFRPALCRELVVRLRPEDPDADVSGGVVVARKLLTRLGRSASAGRPA